MGRLISFLLRSFGVMWITPTAVNVTRLPSFYEFFWCDVVEFEKVGIVRVDCYVRTESRPDARGGDRGRVRSAREQTGFPPVLALPGNFARH